LIFRGRIKTLNTHIKMNKRPIYLAFVFLSLAGLSDALAQTVFTSTGNGDFADPATWDTTGSGSPVVYEIQWEDTVEITTDISGMDSIKVFGELELSTAPTWTGFYSSWTAADINLNAGGGLYVAPGASFTGGRNASFTFCFTLTSQSVITVGTNSISAPVGGWNISGPQYYESGSSFQAGGILPVSWLDIGVEEQDGEAVISWSTAMEQNNSHFDIEKSAGDGQFVVIGTVEGAGSSTNINDYQFKDVFYNGERSFYRIRQVDFDGQYEYSPVFALESESRTPVFQAVLKPNVFSLSRALNTATNLSGLAEGENELQLINSSGQVIQQWSIRADDPTQQHLLQLEKLGKSGIYYLYIQLSNGSTKTLKIQVLP
jgi:hypothetical protein